METHSIILVNVIDSQEFSCLIATLAVTSILALDAEWKPASRRANSEAWSYPSVTLLQLACQTGTGSSAGTLIFLLDLISVPLSYLWEPLKDIFTSSAVLKLGFGFKQDLVYLSHTFTSNGCPQGFDKVEPYMDILSIYRFLQPRKNGRKAKKETMSLASICKELLGITLSKELQCSDWSCRPLSEEQINYAAMDADCLHRIFRVFQSKVALEDSEHASPSSSLGLKLILHQDADKPVVWNFADAVDVIAATLSSDVSLNASKTAESHLSKVCKASMEDSLDKIVRMYGDKIILRESDRKPKKSKRKKSRKNTIFHEKQLLSDQPSGRFGPPPWDQSNGGDGSPKFLCDVMVEGLAKHLRCVGIDAALPHSKKPDPRDLLVQAHRERRVLLTRDAKLLKYQYAVENQIYMVKNLLKNEQLLEVIESFGLRIREEELMSRCAKCNGRFIQKPLTTEEAVEAAKGFQRIPSCLFNKNLEFWQCMDCNQLYWEGTQYHNAVQKFIDVCKLNQNLQD